MCKAKDNSKKKNPKTPCLIPYETFLDTLIHTPPLRFLLLLLFLRSKADVLIY